MTEQCISKGLDTTYLRIWLRIDWNGETTHPQHSWNKNLMTMMMMFVAQVRFSSDEEKCSQSHK